MTKGKKKKNQRKQRKKKKIGNRSRKQGENKNPGKTKKQQFQNEGDKKLEREAGKKTKIKGGEEGKVSWVGVTRQIRTSTMQPVLGRTYLLQKEILWTPCARLSAANFI